MAYLSLAIMYMKINQLSSNPRSKTEVEEGAQDRSGFILSAVSPTRRRARRAQLGVPPLLVGGPGTTARIEAEDEKSRGGEPEHERC